MTPANFEVGHPYPGTLPDHDAAIFEFSKEGPELRLFFSDIPDEAARSVENDECQLGLLRSGDLAVVPWRIGDVMAGDAQFHVGLYPPETRPVPEILSGDLRYVVTITLVDRASGKIRALRHVQMSNALSKVFNEAIAWQLGKLIDREAYDAQVNIYQNQYPDVTEAIAAAQAFEKADNCVRAG